LAQRNYAATVAGEHLGPRSLRQLLDAVLAIGGELELDRALRRIVEAAVALVDARYGALGVLDETHRGLSEFIPVGLDDDAVQAIGHFPKGLGLLGAIIEDARPLRVPDLEQYPRRAGFPPNHPPMTSFLGVPIVVRGRVFGNLYLTDKTSAEELATGLATAAGMVIENARLHGRVKRREAALTATQEILLATTESADDRSMLQLVADRARELARADVATIAGSTEVPGQLVIDILSGPGFTGLLGEVFPSGGSVSGQVMSTGEPIVLEDAANDRRVQQPQVESGDIGPAMWVALNAFGTCVGTLSVARTHGAQPFDDAALELLLLFAAQAGLVLEVQQSRSRLVHLSTLEDRARIARDLHDTVIQRLFATGLSLQSIIGLADNESVRARISSAVDDLDTTIRHIRTAIFGLERSTDTKGVRDRTLNLCAEAARTLGSEPQVTFSGPLDSVVRSALADSMLSVLREALSNVARHAAAQHVAVEVAADATELVLCVTDDGVGLGAGQGDGLDNMRARARLLGGATTIETGPHGGVRVRWSVPLAIERHPGS
jgi:signal transduction histidine kinase